MLSTIEEKIEAILEKLRPAFRRDGGDIEFIRFIKETGVVEVRMQGMCRDCGLSEYTLQMGVATSLQEQLPNVREVVAVK